MNADEIARKLRAWGGMVQTPGVESLMLEAANEINHLKAEIFGQSDLIASLQAQLAEKDAEIARLVAERKHMLNVIRRLDLDCDTCWHNHGDECENPDFDCMTCDCDCICKSCRDNSSWEWRGAATDN